jgi:hypothetical protein
MYLSAVRIVVVARLLLVVHVGFGCEFHFIRVGVGVVGILRVGVGVVGVTLLLIHCISSPFNHILFYFIFYYFSILEIYSENN